MKNAKQNLDSTEWVKQQEKQKEIFKMHNVLYSIYSKSINNKPDSLKYWTWYKTII